MDPFGVHREASMRQLKCLLICSLLGSASLPAAAACYTVFDGSNRVVYHEATPPVNMERPFHETVPQRFPGGHMVFTDNACLPLAAVTPPTGRAPPLLTDRKTAQAMRVPYKVISGDVVMVEQGHVPLRPAVNVIPQVERSSSGDRASSKAKPATVITELREPPMAIVETREGMVVGEVTR